jgi:fucose permease
VRLGLTLAAAGVLVILLPLGDYALFAGFALAGLGCAPVYPSLLHETPENFGKDCSQTIIGMQMASAYTGATLMPLAFGLLAGGGLIWLYPFYLLFFAVAMFALVERANRACASRQEGEILH